MDPISAIASIVGIVGFGIQIAQILQKEIDAIQTATERVEQIVIEIRATATGLINLQAFLLQDHEASLDDRIFNEEGRNEVAHIVRRCNTVFRNIIVLVAKAGNGILSRVDQFQHQVEEEHRTKKGIEESDAKLEIELSNLEHLMWPWKLPKIEQYIADLDRLKLSLVLILSVANLAKTKKQKSIKDNDAESEKWEGSQAETLVQDEIFYQDRGLQEAEKNYKTLTVGVSPADKVAQSKHGAAQVLISNWPDSPSGRGISSITELHESGVILEGFAFNPDDFEQDIIEMPLNMRSIQEHALKRRRWGIRKPLSVWDAFARLPNYQQEVILKFIAKRKRELYDYSRDVSLLPPQLVLISLNVTKYHWQRFLEALKRFRDFEIGNSPKRSTLFIVIARVREPHSNGPEPLILSTTPWHPPSNGGRPSRADRDYTESISSGHYFPSRSRSRRRSPVLYSRSRSRSLTRGHKRDLVVAVARGFKAAYKNRKSKRVVEERRSRSRSRRRRYSSDSDSNNEPGGGAQARAARVAGTQQSTAHYDYAATPAGYSHPPPGTEAPKPGDQGNDEPQLRRVTTLNETEENDPSVIPPPPQPRPIVINTGDLVTTVCREANRGSRSAGGQAIEARYLTNTSRRERDASPATKNNVARRIFVPWSPSDVRITRVERSRRDSSRSRSRGREIVPRRRTWRGHSSSREQRDRRSKKGETVMQLLRKSPERPILRTYTDDGVPPTQRDKAAVAEYYLKKWTTAYDHVRAQNRQERYPTRATGRSRRPSRSGYVPDSGLIEYGEAPIYADQAPYYPPPPGQGGYYDADPYQGAYNPAGFESAGVPEGSGHEARKQKREEREGERRAHESSTSDSDEGRRRRRSKRKDNSGATDNEARFPRRRPSTGFVHTVNTDDEEETEENQIQPPAGLAVPSSQRAYAESVPDDGNEKEDFVEEDV